MVVSETRPVGVSEALAKAPDAPGQGAIVGVSEALAKAPDAPGQGAICALECWPLTTCQPAASAAMLLSPRVARGPSRLSHALSASAYYGSPTGAHAGSRCRAPCPPLPPLPPMPILFRHGRAPPPPIPKRLTISGKGGTLCWSLLRMTVHLRCRAARIAAKRRLLCPLRASLRAAFRKGTCRSRFPADIWQLPRRGLNKCMARRCFLRLGTPPPRWIAPFLAAHTLLWTGGSPLAATTS